MIDKLDESNFVLYAAKNYDNPQCFDTLEFYEDLSRFKYIKRLFNRYEESGELKERLILNHLIILYNVFGAATTKMLFFKLNGHLHLLKPFILLLGFLPDKVSGVGVENKTIISSDIPMDDNIVQILRKI
jgi:hypothetical protein